MADDETTPPEPENPLAIPDEHTLDDLLRYFATQDAPRVFTLCRITPGLRGATVLAWGMSFADSAVLYLPGEKSVGFFDSADSAHALYRRLGDVRLVWPDYVPVRELTQLP
ncbi:MAG TPA: hypothetical protein VHW44_25170 [Pseudonocardiaceae bacterium]|nr:hypothetical protein [Pseudonocardiaceae bacterium]